MASSSVTLTGPWPKVAKASVNTAMTALTSRRLGNFRVLSLCFKGRLRFGEFVTISGDPNIQGWQQKNAHRQCGDQPADDNNREGPLGVRADGVRKGGRYQSESRH